MTAVRSHLGTALTAVRLLARGDDGWPWRALLAHLDRTQRLEQAAREYVAARSAARIGWPGADDDEAWTRLVAVLDDDETKEQEL